MVWAPSSWIGARGIVLKLRMHFLYIRRHPFLAFKYLFYEFMERCVGTCSIRPSI